MTSALHSAVLRVTSLMDESQHEDPRPPSQAVPLAEIFGLWLHSQEEDTQTTTVYRPRGYLFPPSRGRSAVEFRPDGTYIEYSSGPDDRGQAIVGSWQDLGSCRVQITVPRSGGSPSVRRILSYAHGVLVIEK
jgi:hypothetical protein